MIKSLIEENKAIIASKKSSGIQKNNSSSTKESREAGSSVLHKTNSSSKESKEPALMAIQKTSSSTSREFATSNIQKTNSGTPSEANELVSAEHQKKSSGTPLETKDPKESNPLAYYRKNYNWREEFSHVDPQDVTTKITILNDTLKILKSTLMKTIAMHNDMQSSSPVTFIINPIYFIHKLKALTVLVSNLIKPPVERLRTMSVLSAQADDIREFNTSFRSLKAVSIDPAMAPDPSSSLSSEGSKLLAQSSEQLLFPMSEKKSQKVEKKDDQGTLVKSRRKSKTPNGEVIKRKGSVRGTFNQLTMFKAIPTSGDRSESPLRPTILPPKPEPIAGSTISRQ